MAYWIQKTPNNHNLSGYKEYRCDYRTDIERLPRFGIEGKKQEGDSTSSYPCSYGSECLCLEDSSVWSLGKDTNTWIEIGEDS